MTLLMIKFTSTIIDDWNLDETHANNMKQSLIYSSNSIMKFCHGWLECEWKIT